jgi:hypothetical protein
MIAIVTEVKWNLIVILIFIYFMTKDDDHLFIYLLAIGTSCFENYLCSSFAHLFSGCLVLWEVRFLSSLYIYTDYSSLVRCIDRKDFLPFCRLSHKFRYFFPLMSRCYLARCSPILSILSLNSWTSGVLFRKLLPMPICSSVFPVLSYSSYIISELTLDLWFTLNWY